MGKSGVKQLSGLRSISDDNLSEAPGYSTQRVDIALAQHQQIVSSLSTSSARKAAMKAGRRVLQEVNEQMDRAKKCKSKSPQKQTAGTPLRDHKTITTGKTLRESKKSKSLSKSGRQQPPTSQQHVKKPHRYQPGTVAL